jgi:hypothetical protein
VTVRLGLPQPTGEALAHAFADANGRWSAALTIPDRLPSGELIAEGPFYLVAMVEHNVALASAQFDFTPNPSPVLTHDAAMQIVRDLLNNIGSDDVTRYLSSDLRGQVIAGQPVHQALGLRPMAWDSYDVAAPLDRPSEVLFVPVKLNYATFAEERIFILAVENNQWRISGSGLQNPAPEPQPTAVDTVGAFLRLAQSDRSMEQARVYLGGPLRELVESGQIDDVAVVLQDQYAFTSFAIGNVLGTDGGYVLIQATLFYTVDQTDRSEKLFKLINHEDIGWRIVEVTNAQAPPPEQS